MGTALPVKEEIKEHLLRVVCFIVLLFGCYLIYLDWQYSFYLEEYRYDDTEKLLGIPVDQADKYPYPQKSEVPLQQAPLSRYEYILSHASFLWVLAYASLAGSILLICCGLVVKKRLGSLYGAHLDRIHQDLDALEAHYSFQEQLIHGIKQGAGVICHIVKGLGRNAHGKPLSHHQKETLLKGALTLSESLSLGMANVARESIDVIELLDQIKAQFSDIIREKNIAWSVACSSPVSLIGDPLFIKQILLNVVGYPLYHMPKDKEVLISLTQSPGYVYIEVKDHRFILTHTTKAFLKLPDEGVNDTLLQQICTQNNIGYESFETEEGIFTTKLSLPSDPGQVHNLHMKPTQSQFLH